eukprot:548994_1
MSNMSISSLSGKSNLVKPIRTDESTVITVLDVIRLIFSLVIFSFACVACGYAMYAQISLMPDTLPIWLVYITFFFCICLLSITEGLHVAAVQVANHSPNQYIQLYPRSASLIRYQNQGRNFQHFLIGRQIIVVFCVFIVGRCTTFDGFFVYLPPVFEDITMFTGFLGVVFVVQVAQLTPQILSSNFAAQYMNLWGVNYIYYLCIAIEKTGICHAVWLFCWLIQSTTCFKRAFGVEGVFEYDVYNIDSISTKPMVNKENIIDQTDKFMDIMHLKYETKQRILKFGNDLRNDLNLDTERNKNEQVEDEEKIPLQSADKLKQKHNITKKDMIGYKFPTRLQCAKQFVNDGLEIPDFLLNESDPNFIPPHLMLLHLLQNNK